MTHGPLNFTDAQTANRWEITRRAEELRAQEAVRLISAVSRRIRAAFATVTGRRPAIERVFIPRSPSAAIF